MSETVIKVEGLSKLYRIGARQEDYKTLRDALTNAFKSSLKIKPRVKNRGNSSFVALSSTLPSNDSTIWALKDVSFEVKRGEVVGIIGRNGAGKTTLLKILSRITEPTEGYAEIRGRVGSLLEVGTGFHPELSGRENIYLNGAILGMKKAEIDRKFDEIVAFAEVEKFIDTPVKHYSSGMYVRLAFAVAAHLEPEILFVDEVLAVGDVGFQKKCLGKMGDLRKEGRTVLFVSHNMGAVYSLTQKCIYLREGRINAYRGSREVIEQYIMESIERIGAGDAALDFYRRNPYVDSPITISEIWIDNRSKELPTIVMGSAFTIYVQVQVCREIQDANLTIILKNVHGERVVVLFSLDAGFCLSLKPGRHLISVRVEDLSLSPGQYFADIGINQSTQTFAYDVIVEFPLFQFTQNSQVIHWLERPWGVVHCNGVSWQIVN
jgi:lipopolysaccharide transport system ATP-binding protein